MIGRGRVRRDRQHDDGFDRGREQDERDDAATPRAAMSWKTRSCTPASALPWSANSQATPPMLVVAGAEGQPDQEDSGDRGDGDADTRRSPAVRIAASRKALARCSLRLSRGSAVSGDGLRQPERRLGDDVAGGVAAGLGRRQHVAGQQQVEAGQQQERAHRQRRRDQLGARGDRRLDRVAGRSVAEIGAETARDRPAGDDRADRGARSRRPPSRRWPRHRAPAG